MSTEKRSKIKNISTLDDLLQMTSSILKNSGANDTKRINNTSLSCQFNVTGIGIFTNFYYHTLEHLTKSSNQFSIILEAMQKASREKKYSKLFIVSSNNITNGFKTRINNQFSTFEIDFWTISDLVQIVDERYSNFWSHNDQSLLNYEEDFKNKLDEVNDIRKLVAYKSSHEKLLNIFVKPKLYLKTKDKQSNKASFKKQLLSDLNSYKGLTLINGEAGSGKTRALKELALSFIEENTSESNKKILPLFVYATNLNDYREANGNVILEKYITTTLKNDFDGLSFDDLLNKYEIVFLLDTIDEFDENIQKELYTQFEILLEKKVKIYLGTRYLTSDTILLSDVIKINELHLGKFDLKQVEKFLTKYFYKNIAKANDLIQSIKDNKIIEKLPITPLNLSLLSLLYEENNYEIPSTVTDIYSNFSNLLLGRSIVDSRFKFLDVTIKENILSAYALKLLKLKNNQYFSKEEFFKFIASEFSNISGTIDLSQLPDALEYLIKNTGFLVIHEEKYVKFRHDSYMEYFAAKEIFQNKRGEESLLIENFLDINWQFAAIFYGGFSRRMPAFLSSIIERVEKANTIKDYISGIGGLGYLIQSLYLTDDSIRKNAVMTALIKVEEAYDLSKKISSDSYFKILDKTTVPILALFNSFLFFENFNSITTKEPLKIAFEELYQEYLKYKDTNYPYINNLSYKLFTIAWTLSSGKVRRSEEIQKLIFNTDLVNNPFFELLLDMATEMSAVEEIKKLKSEIQRAKSKKSKKYKDQFFQSDTIDFYLKTPASKLRFSKYDLIIPNKKFKIITEGITDAIILQHSYYILTQTAPYWEIIPVHKEKGGANELAKSVNNAFPLISENSIIIGLFDNDAKGLQEFKGGLKSDKFKNLDISDDGECRIKKHKEASIYGLLLPVPANMQHFIFKDQNLNVFETEHYFPKALLEEKKMLEDHPVPEIYKIKDSKSSKKAFANDIAKINDRSIFANFIYLFKELDRIFNKSDEIEYFD